MVLTLFIAIAHLLMIAILEQSSFYQRAKDISQRLVSDHVTKFRPLSETLLRHVQDILIGN